MVRTSFGGAILLTLSLGAFADEPQDAVMTATQNAAIETILSEKDFCPRAIPESFINESCPEPGISYAKCYQRVANRLNANEQTTRNIISTAAAEPAKTDSDRLVREVVTTTSVPGLAGAASDFVNRGQVTAMPVIRNLDDPYTLGAAFIPFKIDRGWFVFRGGIFVNPQPELQPVLKQRLLNDGRVAQLSSLDKPFNADDDYSWQVELSFRSKYVGRQLEGNQDSFDGLLGSMIKAESATAAMNPKVIPDPDPSTQSMQIGGMKLRSDSRLIEALSCEAVISNDFAKAAATAPARHGLNEFGTFLNNQPDIVIRYRRLHREPVIEANAWNVNVTATTGLLNLNLLRLLGDCSGALHESDCVTQYDSMRTWTTLKDLAPSASIYGEYGRITDLSYTLDATPPVSTGPVPLPGLPTQQLNIDGGTYKRYGGAIGAVVEPLHEENGVKYSTRIDLAYDVWNLDNNNERLDYQLQRLTVTRRVGSVNFAFNLMRRDKAKFRSALLPSEAIGAGIGYSWF